MGTRNLTCVVKDGEYKVAQYCQWDGYPSGNGVEILEFLKNMDRNHFENRLDDCVFISNDEIQKRWKECGADDSGWVNMEISDKFKEKYPLLHRDTHPADALKMIHDSTGKVELYNDIGFAKDGLYCEWAYVVDFDKNTFEVYRGFQKSGVPEDNRFGNEVNENGYMPVSLVKTYDLEDLPSEKQFLRDLEDSDDEIDYDGPEELTKENVEEVIDAIRGIDIGYDIIQDVLCDYLEEHIDDIVKK